MQGILKKWEEANQKIFEKYPSDKPNDLAVLESALEEVHKPKGDGMTESQLNRQTNEEKLKRLRDQEVKEYLKEIKMKE